MYICTLYLKSMIQLLNGEEPISLPPIIIQIAGEYQKFLKSIYVICGLQSTLLLFGPWTFIVVDQSLLNFQKLAFRAIE